MKTITQLAVCAGIAVLHVTASNLSAQEPSAQVKEHAEAVIAAVNGNDAAVDRLVKEHFTPPYQAVRSAAARREWFKPLREQLGKVEITRLMHRDPDTVMVAIKGSTGVFANFVLGLDRQTSLISSLAYEAPEDV